MSEKARCPECGRNITVNKSGRLRAHGYGRSSWYATGPGCPGSGEFPVLTYICGFCLEKRGHPHPAEVTSESDAFGQVIQPVEEDEK